MRGREPLERARKQRLDAREDRRRCLAGQLLVDDRLRQREEQARRAIDPHAKRSDAVDEPRERGVGVAQVCDRRDRVIAELSRGQLGRGGAVESCAVALDRQQAQLRGHAAVRREAAHAAARGEHAVAGHDQRERVPAQRLTDRTRRARLAEARCQVAVGDGLAGGDAARHLVDAAVEGRYLLHVEQDRAKLASPRRARGSGSARPRVEPRRALPARSSPESAARGARVSVASGPSGS